MATDADFHAVKLVRFPLELSLPDAPGDDLLNAAEAVRREYRNSVRWKRLRCRRVSPVLERQDEAVYVLEVGQALEFDWTWEGAVAFRPFDLDGFTGDDVATEDVLWRASDNGDGAAWSGEVVEVDETNGRIFVWASDADSPPTTGSFYIRPFEFLAFLHAVYCDPAFSDIRPTLPARLNAARGDVHPPVSRPPSGGLTELRRMWEHGWGVLWGPPGTGKTYRIGRQVAACLEDPDERILVVSTTNKATDEVALSIGRACRQAGPADGGEGRVLRIGKSAQFEMFERRELLHLLEGTETDLLHEIGCLTQALHKAPTHEERAIIRRQVQDLRRQMKDASFNIFVSPDVDVVVATAFKAMTLLNNGDIHSMIAEGDAPFTTIFIDEAGLISRSTAAALSLLASRRVVLVGDSKQLAPISKMSRILPTAQATWLASSGLSHLRSLDQVGPAVHLLREQHRMHPHVCTVVSAYQYENGLLNAPAVYQRQIAMPPSLEGLPRSVWYVLDEDDGEGEVPSIRAERGPGNRSWVRPKTRSVLDKFFADPAVRQATGLYISPFVAQARDVRSYLAEQEIESWMAATVHSQQGTEADFVVFDTVNAGSYGWPYDEWKRLVNVGLSRAREFVMVLASRAEMQEPYLRSLTLDLAPYVLKRVGRTLEWINVSAEVEYEVPEGVADNPNLVGNQIAQRQRLRPVLSFEQQRLCCLRLDGKPRLVRGVAGSGKTVVLAHWLLKTMQRLKDQPEAKVWAVFANRSLQRLITDTIEDAWRSEGNGTAFPWGRVELWHILDLFRMLLPEVGLKMRPPHLQFNYSETAAAYLRRCPAEKISPRCHAMFVDEAQDMGPSTLKLLSALVAQSDEQDPNSRSINIFYDNAQNIYRRGTPKWSEMGLDMRGRSSVMKESFRSTQPVTEYALNVLYRLSPPDSDTDHAELVKRGLIERTRRGGEDWWDVRFNQIDGPAPTFHRFPDRVREVEAIGTQLVHWIRGEGVRPGDICVLYNGQTVGTRVEREVGARLNAIGCRLSRQTSQAFDEDERTVKLTTPHSYKGYDSEVVVIVGVDQFMGQGVGVLANSLYVAMTRARSILAVYGTQQQSPEAVHLLAVLGECLDLLVERPDVDHQMGEIDDVEEVARRLCDSHRPWLEKLWRTYFVQQEPIEADDGEIIGQPLFWFRSDDGVFACYDGAGPNQRERYRLEDAGVRLIEPGAEVG